MADGIYVVDIDDGNKVSVVTRRVVIAETAADARRIAAAQQWPLAKPGAWPEDRIEACRLGDYVPGPRSASLTPWQIIATQTDHR